MNETRHPLIEARDLVKCFPVERRFFAKHTRMLTAIRGLNLAIYPGETFGLVGESGCGKTTVGRTLVRLYEPDDGSIHLDGDDISHLDSQALLPYRARMQMIFQDPYASLNPRMTVLEIIQEPLRTRKELSAAQRQDIVRELLDTVGLKREHMSRYPHEFSGGQRQRIGIARALATHPAFIVCDEPISALDVSIQAQVVNMLESLQQRLDLTYLFISHDLQMVRHISHRVGVMYLGLLVESALVDELYQHMCHPYTRALMSAAPVADPKQAAQAGRIILQGDVPSPLSPPSGCPFRTRCPEVMPICAEELPELQEVAPGHLCACHRAVPGANSDVV